MEVYCVGQTGISGVSLDQSKIGEVRGAITPLTLPPSAAQVKAEAGNRAGEKRERGRERKRERERERGGQSFQD